ncbi:hypothetical protein VNO78_11432 [Psophocarpus tetragonolobus]|uniref:Leucine-rich repeat-containing N-terminal plant-type domain-containing protein n=1 Tax=Psophocarpus tetragonolobus TaxID=3891 RepID=A0AAN9SMB1_PSOTE
MLLHEPSLEKIAPPNNNSLRSYEVIGAIKSKVEAVWPRVNRGVFTIEVKCVLQTLGFQSASNQHLSSAAAAVSEQCNPEDKKVLLQIKKELGKPRSLSSWKQKTDCCVGWVGVTCGTKSQAYRINSLSFDELDLPKPVPIPLSITNLPYLQYLFITDNPNIVGPLPPSLTKLKLHNLYIGQTNISGPIPDFLSQIKTLEYLKISDSKLTGTLPAWLPSLPILTGISFDGNQLTGTIPDSFGSFPKGFDTLTLSANRLTGKIPPSLANLNLVTLHLHDNMFQGDASFLFGKRTRQIYLSNNKFVFDLGKVRVPKTVEGFEIANNGIYGTLPKELTLLKLTWFNVSFNNLCGPIPQGGMLQTFDAAAYANNKCLCGSPLPPCKRF